MSFYKGFKNGRGEYVEVFRNPSKKEIHSIQSWGELGNIRGFIGKDGELLVWDSYANIHSDVYVGLGFAEGALNPLFVPVVLEKGFVTITEGWVEIGTREQVRKYVGAAKHELQHLLGKFKIQFYPAKEGNK